MTSAATADSLIAAHEARLQALMAQDTVALAQVVAQDMRFTGPDGNTITRAEVVAAIELLHEAVLAIAEDAEGER